MHFPQSIFKLPQWGKLTPKARALAMYFYVRSDSSGKCFPSLTTICRDTGMHRTTTVRCIKELESGGFLSRILTNGIKTVYQMISEIEAEPVLKLVPVINIVPVLKLAPDQVQNEYHTSTKISTLTIKEHIKEQQQTEPLKSLNSNHKNIAAVLVAFGIDHLGIYSLLAEPWANRMDLSEYVESKIAIVERRRLNNPAGALIEALRKNWVDLKCEKIKEKEVSKKAARAEREKRICKLLEKFQKGEALTDCEYSLITNRLPIDCDIVWETTEDGYRARLNILKEAL